MTLDRDDRLLRECGVCTLHRRPAVQGRPAVQALAERARALAIRAARSITVSTRSQSGPDSIPKRKPARRLPRFRPQGIVGLPRYWAWWSAGGGFTFAMCRGRCPASTPVSANPPPSEERQVRGRCCNGEAEGRKVRRVYEVRAFAFAKSRTPSRASSGKTVAMRAEDAKITARRRLRVLSRNPA